MSAQASIPAPQYVTLICDGCFLKGGGYLGHYDLIRCSCGKIYWALRPLDGGPLVAFPWPGSRVPTWPAAPEEREAA